MDANALTLFARIVCRKSWGKTPASKFSRLPFPSNKLQTSESRI